MKQVLHILKYKLISFLRLETKLTASIIFRSIASSLMYLLFAIGAYLFTRQMIWSLLYQFKIGMFLLHEFMSILLFIFILSINIGNMVVAYSTLYKSSEINFYFTKPVSPIKIFLIKYLDNFFYSSSTLLLILLAVLLGYASYFNLGIFDFFFLSLNFLTIMISASLSGVIILLFIMRFISSFGKKKVISVIVALYSISVFAFFKISAPNDLVKKVIASGSYVINDAVMFKIIPGILNYFPNHWLSQTAWNLTIHDYQKAGEYFILQSSLAIALFTIMYILGNKWYYKTWLSGNAYLMQRKINNSNSSFFNQKNFGIFGLQSDAIFRREAALFIREPLQVIHSLVLVLLILIFLLSVKGLQFIGIGNYFLQTAIYLSIFVFNMLLIITLSLRFIFPLLSLEGQSFWKIKSAPLSSHRLFVSKISPYAAIILIISLLISYISNKDLKGSLTLFSVVITFIISVTVIIINFGMGAAFVNYKEKNAIRIASSQGATLSFLLNVLYIVAVSILIFKPLSGIFYSITTGRIISYTNLYFMLIPIVIISISLIAVFIRVLNKSMAKDF